jgi:ATP-dependent Clp protease ATP-binding subunit ClpA
MECAREEAARLKHNFVGTEHLLLGLIKLGEGRATEILTNVGLDLNELRESVEEVAMLPEEPKWQGQLPVSARALQSMEFATQEAKALESKDIDTEHVLLGLLKQEEGVAAEVLWLYDFDYQEAYGELKNIIIGKPSSANEKRKKKTKGNWLFPYGNFPKEMDFWTNKRARARDEWFTEQTNRAIGYAHDIAKHLKHNYVGTEHLLLGLIQLGKGRAIEILTKIGPDLDKLSESLLRASGPPSTTVPKERLWITLGYQKTMAFSIDEANLLKSKGIDPEHMLLALLKEKEGVIVEVFQKYGITYDKVYDEIKKTL